MWHEIVDNLLNIAKHGKTEESRINAAGTLLNSPHFTRINHYKRDDVNAERIKRQRQQIQLLLEVLGADAADTYVALKSFEASAVSDVRKSDLSWLAHLLHLDLVEEGRL